MSISLKNKCKILRVSRCLAVLLIVFSLYFTINWYIDRNKEVAISRDEFIKTVDCAPLFDKYGTDTQYKISFDIRSDIPGKILVYQQNGSGARYAICKEIYTTNEYQHIEFITTPVLIDADIEESYLSFYGTYGTGVIPDVKNVSIQHNG